MGKIHRLKVEGDPFLYTSRNTAQGCLRNIKVKFLCIATAGVNVAHHQKYGDAPSNKNFGVSSYPEEPRLLWYGGI